jgi:hypothetical protein
MVRSKFVRFINAEAVRWQYPPNRVGNGRDNVDLPQGRDSNNVDNGNQPRTVR